MLLKLTAKRPYIFKRPSVLSQFSTCKMASTPTDDENDVIFETFSENDRTGKITLNRPKALNSLNLSMVRKLHAKLTEWQSTKSLVLIRGAGERAFCAGGDVRVIAEHRLQRGDTQLGRSFFRCEYSTNALIGGYQPPYVALADGILMGGGVGISVHAPYRVVTERTLFAMPETQIGLFPDVGGTYFLPRLTGRLGYYLALTGVRLKGADVLHAGIGTHFCRSDRLEQLEKALLECESVSTSRISSRQRIEQILCDFHEKQSVGEFSLKPHLEQIDCCFGAATMEEIVARLQRDGSEWALKTQETLSKMSPTSLKVTLKLLQNGANLTLNECLKIEFRVACNCVEGHDFPEGVRALLIDKTHQPNWCPSTLEGVSAEIVDKHFQKLENDLELKHKL